VDCGSICEGLEFIIQQLCRERRAALGGLGTEMAFMTNTSRPLQVAHVTLGLDVGGQEKLLLEFARHADHARHALTVISLSGRGKLAEALEGLGSRVIALEEPPGLRPGLIGRLWRLFRRERFDVVHTHDDKPLLYAGPAAWLAQVPRRVHTHHHGALAQFTRRQRLLVRWASRLVDPFVCVSHDAARFAAAEGFAPSRLRVLWNGIDLDRFPFSGPRPGGPAIVVARLSPEKDIQTLLYAVRQIIEALPQFHLEIAGDGPCRDELVRQAAELRLGEHVRFLGEVRDVATLLARASLFVLPSQSEGISLTILEAMASGLPVVATHVGGNPEVVADGRTGLLVPPRDATALAHGIARVAGNVEDAQLMGHAGRRRVEAHFDIRTMVAQYEALYAVRSPWSVVRNSRQPSLLSLTTDYGSRTTDVQHVRG
jgi:glycosyltransferase involved in cell wall biosynthesis